MNKAQITINKLKTLLGMEVKLMQMKLADGETILEADPDFEVGASIMVITTDEQMIPLPVNDPATPYELEDGRLIQVTEEGIIASIEEAGAEEEAPEVEEEVAANDTPAQAPLPKSIIESVSKETKFSAEDVKELIDRNTELEAKIAELSKVEETEEVELSVIKPNPEKQTAPETNGFKWGGSANMTTEQRVMAKLANKNN